MEVDKRYYVERIYSYERLLEATVDQIYKKERELEDVNEFNMMHQRSMAEMEDHFNWRESRIENGAPNPQKVRIFKEYKEEMMNLLGGNEIKHHFSMKQEEQTHILRVINQLENEIQTLKSQRYSYENMISNLHYELRKAEV